MELNWEIYELPESSRVYWVQGTIIHTVYGALPNPEQGYYKTRNEAKRAVSRYRKEAKDYWYSHPDNFIKNTKKQINMAFDEVFEDSELIDFSLSESKTIKIAKFKMPGLADYKKRSK